MTIEELKADLESSRILITKPHFPNLLKIPLQNHIFEVESRLELQQILDQVRE